MKVSISKRWIQEDKAHEIYRKTNISYPLMRTHTCAYLGVRNNSFSENVACFIFLKQPKSPIIDGFHHILIKLQSDA